jgi:hypothetical protein
MKLPKKYQDRVERWLNILETEWDGDFDHYIHSSLSDYKKMGYDVSDYASRLYEIRRRNSVSREEL